jgi:hypothetical protein
MTKLGQAKTHCPQRVHFSATIFGAFPLRFMIFSLHPAKGDL